MDDKKTIEVLLGILKKYELGDEEKEALHSAVGILSWTKLAQSGMKRMKEKREKEKERSVSGEAFPRRKNFKKKY